MARNILVTGGSTGIGRAVATVFAENNENVVITGRRSQVLSETANALGSNVHALVCDASDPIQIDACMEELPNRIDVLVNCAGGDTDFGQPHAKELSIIAANWHANLNSNLMSAVLMTEAVRRRLTNGGAVIHIGSIAADIGVGAYGAAKAALASWNVGLAASLGPTVTANVISPGYITQTDFFDGKLPVEVQTALVDATITKRAGTPEDVATTAYFLASGGARHITGQVIAVNGGERTTR